MDTLKIWLNRVRSEIINNYIVCYLDGQFSFIVVLSTFLPTLDDSYSINEYTVFVIHTKQKIKVIVNKASVLLVYIVICKFIYIKFY